MDELVWLTHGLFVLLVCIAVWAAALLLFRWLVVFFHLLILRV